MTASGMDLGTDLVFGTRLGFSGTPSDLLPTSLSPCHYEPGSEAFTMQTLSDADQCRTAILHNWNVDSLIHWIARHADPVFHALIDTGALITGIVRP